MTLPGGSTAPWMVSRMSDYGRVCDPCMEGGECQQPYEALDGTVYSCLNFRRALDGEPNG